MDAALRLRRDAATRPAGQGLTVVHRTRTGLARRIQLSPPLTTILV